MKTALARAFRIGWESAKADFRPLLVLWGFACLLTAGYFGVEPLRAAAGRLGDVMRTAGWRGAFASQLFFHGVVPWAFFRLFRTIRPPRPALVSAAIALWSATLGIVCFGLSHLQDALFGTGTDVLTANALEGGLRADVTLLAFGERFPALKPPAFVAVKEPTKWDLLAERLERDMKANGFDADEIRRTKARLLVE